jgi:hypothetical protein
MYYYYLRAAATDSGGLWSLMHAPTKVRYVAMKRVGALGIVGEVKKTVYSELECG